MSHFQQHYAQLSDDALIEIAVTRELMPEAATALQLELQKRGIDDLSKHQQVRTEEIKGEEAHRKNLIDHKQRVIGWRTKFLFASALLISSYGLYRLAVPNVERPGDDGGLMLVLGIAIFLFAIVSSWLSKVWIKHVIHRAPPR